MNIFEATCFSSGVSLHEPFLPDGAFNPEEEKSYVLFCPSGPSGEVGYSRWDVILNILAPILKERGVRIIAPKGYKAEEHENVKILDASFSSWISLCKDALFFIGGINHFSYMCLVHHVQAFVIGKSINPLDDFGRVHFCEEIGLKVEEFLGKISYSFPQFEMDRFETVHLGGAFGVPIVEVIPDKKTALDETLKGAVLNVRMDTAFDLEFLQKLFDKGASCNILTKQPIPESFLSENRRMVGSLSVELGFGVQRNYLEGLKRIGIPFTVFADPDKETFKSLQLEFIDFCVEPLKSECPISKETVEEMRKNPDSYMFASAKSIIKGGSQYLSKAHVDAGVHATGQMFQPILPVDEFWEDSDYFLIIKVK